MAQILKMRWYLKEQCVVKGFDRLQNHKSRFRTPHLSRHLQTLPPYTYNPPTVTSIYSVLNKDLSLTQKYS